MQTEKTQRLLLFFESPNDAQELINQLRNHGCPTRAHHLHAGSALDAVLQEETWDLFICDSGNSGDSDNSDSSNSSDANQQWLPLISGASEAGVPVLLLSDDCDRVKAQAFAAGASDVVAKDDLAHVLHAALREIDNRRHRLEKAAMLAAHTELQARYELLMGGSQDAIAYITDGMHVDANEAYASQFGYDDCDELACMPVIDLVAPEEQHRFKRFLRDYRAHTEQEVELETIIQDQLGNQHTVCMHFAPANYEGEACTQVIIRAPGEQTTASKNNFVAGALQQLQLSGTSNSPSTLGYLHLENLSEIRDAVGIIAAEAALEQLLAFIHSTCPTEVVTGQLSQDGFGLLHPATTAAAAKPHFEELLNAIGRHIIDVDGRSLRCLCSVMLIDVDERCLSIEAGIDQAYHAISEARSRGESQFVSIHSPPAAPINLHGDDINLDRLLLDKQLALYFQPIVSLRGEPGEYYEMSCLLKDHDHDTLSIESLAQQLKGKNDESVFDRWLLMNAITQLREKRVQCVDTRLLVNISSSCLHDKTLRDWLKDELKAASLHPSALALQVNERHVDSSVKQSQRLFEELSELGCGCSISEFGSGNNSASILQHVTASMLKFSHDIVSQGQTDATQRELLQQLIQQATKMGPATIVPNVCSAATLASLWQLGASFIQGDYLQQPSPTMDYEFAEIA